MRDGTQGMHQLRAVPGTDRYDVLVCDAPFCGGEFIIPFEA